MKEKLTLGSLFDGIGGFPLSAKEYGITVMGVNGKIENPSMNVVYVNTETGETLEGAPTEVGSYRLGIYVRPSDNYTRADKWINFTIDYPAN